MAGSVTTGHVVLLAEGAQRLQPWVDVRIGMVVVALVQATATDDAQTRTIRPAERGDRLGQPDRLADRRLQFELVVVVQAQDIGFLLGRRPACPSPGRGTAGIPRG